jgi:hypothetical protein
MKSIGLLALLPALTCAFFLPIPPLFNNQLLNSSNISLVSHASHVSHASNSSYVEVEGNMTEEDFKEICTIVHFAESELCGNTSSVEPHVPPQLCSLLSLMNQTFCQDETAEKGEKHVNINQNETQKEKTNFTISEESENVYEEFYKNVYIEEIKNNNTELTPKDLCPVFDLVDKTFCTSHDNKLNPKDLCPLLEFVEKEVCV